MRTRPAASPFHFPVAALLYTLLVLVLLAGIAVSIWWARRLRPSLGAREDALIVEDSEDLREAVESGRSALRTVDDARAAIIACYLAMEQSLAERGTARSLADTPDELLARARASGVVRGTAASRLTALFYEARFSSHPLGPAQRDAAERALDELAAALAQSAAESSDRAGGRRGAAREAARGRGRSLSCSSRRALVLALAVAGYAMASWAGLTVVAVATAATAVVILRVLLPAATPDKARTAREKAQARSLSGYSHRRFVVQTSCESLSFYQAELRPVLEHLLAARLAERHGVNLYADPEAARRLLCRTSRDADLWPWIDPAARPQAPAPGPAPGRRRTNEASRDAP